MFDIRLVRLFFLLTIVVSFSSQTIAERYQVSEDSFGELSAEKIQPPLRDNADDSNLAKPSSELANDATDLVKESTDDSKLNSIDGKNVVEESLVEVVSVEQVKEKKVDVSKKVLPDNPTAPYVGQSALSEDTPQELISANEEIQLKEKKLSVFEKAFLDDLERENQSAKSVLGTGTAASSGSRSQENFSVEEYVDGDLLLENGGVRASDEKSPYFIQINADGKPYITAYDPNLEKAFRESQRNKTVQFTDAKIYERSQEEKSLLNIPSGADQKARDILESGQKSFESYFSAFSNTCCEQLVAKYADTIERGRGYYFELTDEDIPYRFTDGDSRYLLIQLSPSTQTNYALRFRTFIRADKSNNIRHGVFFPQLATLDKNLRPLRIITGPLLKYVPETWSKYGYLQGIFEIDQTRDNEEAYLLVKTSKDVLKTSSTVVSEEETITIEHMDFGSFEVEILVN